MPSSVVLATLCLNEMEHLPNLYIQHRNWPGLKKWVFVESADEMYRQASPTMVSPKGLSIDGTSEFLQDLSRFDSRVVYIPFGISKHPTNPAQGKCICRTCYLEEADKVQPEFFFVLDADEYYTYADQAGVMKCMKQSRKDKTCFCFKHRHPWRPRSLSINKLFQLEVVGGFWDIPLCRGWRWFPDLSYKTNHNTPERKNGKLLDEAMVRFYQVPGSPECVHMAWTSTVKCRHAKNAYYKARGEGVRDHRGVYVESRAAYESWRPGTALPGGAKVVRYTGPIPECFLV